MNEMQAFDELDLLIQEYDPETPDWRFRKSIMMKLIERIRPATLRLSSAQRPQQTAADNAALIAAIPEMVAALEASVADLEKVSNWLGRLATASEASARDTRFMSLADANRTDAKNYRATIKSISGSIETARAVLKKVKP